MKFTQFNRPFEKSSRGVRSLENLLQGLIYQHYNGMSLKVMAKLLGGDQMGIGKLLNFQVSDFSSHENFANVVH